MIVFFDVDGTIVDDETQVIPESAVRAIRKLRENGHRAIVNTGRPFGNLDHRLQDMAFSGWCSACGQEILLDGKWLRRDAPNRDLCRFIRECIHKSGCKLMFEAEDALLRDGDHSDAEIANWECATLMARGIPVLEIADVPDWHFVKFCAYDVPGSDPNLLKRLVSPYFTGTNRAGGMIEFVMNGHSKAHAMEEVMAALGAGRSEVYAIGDTTNDLPMFAMAGHSACMGGGMEEAKTAADFVTDTVLNDGLEKALQHFGLI